MVGRFSQVGIYREIFLQREFFLLLFAGAVALASQTISAIPPKIALAMLGISLLINGGPIIINSFKGLLKRSFNVDELVTFALILAIINGDFLEASIVAFVMRIGELIEEAVSEGARKDISALLSLSVDQARVVSQDGSQKTVPLAEVVPNNVVMVLAGERIPVDGVVSEGKSGVDESYLTGESLPVLKSPGSEVISGSLNGDGVLKIIVKKCGEESRLGKIITAVVAAEASRPQAARLVDRFARWFTPVIVSAAVIAYLITKDINRSITVLIVGCPCAFVLIAPLGSLAASGRAASQGALLKGSRLIEKIAQTHTLYFDKTGTLTTGKLQVASILPVNGSVDETIELAYALESSSSHPIAQGICVYFQENYTSKPTPGVSDVENIPGVGIKGQIDGKVISASRETDSESLDSSIKNHLDKIAQNGNSPIFVRKGEELTGIIEMGDSLRQEGASVVSWFKKQGMQTVGLLSGDHQSAVTKVSEKAGLSPAFFRMSPEDKAKHIKKGDSENTLFIGDGLNDAVALVSSGVGIAMDNGDGLDTALESADAVMVGGSLWKAPFLYRLSKRISLLMKLDIAFALCFNLCAVVLGYFGIITPITGAIMHNIGAVIVALSFVVGMRDINVRELKV